MYTNINPPKTKALRDGDRIRMVEVPQVSPEIRSAFDAVEKDLFPLGYRSLGAFYHFSVPVYQKGGRSYFYQWIDPLPSFLAHGEKFVSIYLVRSAQFLQNYGAEPFPAWVSSTLRWLAPSPDLALKILAGHTDALEAGGRKGFESFSRIIDSLPVSGTGVLKSNLEGIIDSFRNNHLPTIENLESFIEDFASLPEIVLNQYLRLTLNDPLSPAQHREWIQTYLGVIVPPPRPQEDAFLESLLRHSRSIYGKAGVGVLSKWLKTVAAFRAFSPPTALKALKLSTYFVVPDRLDVLGHWMIYLEKFHRIGPRAGNKLIELTGLTLDKIPLEGLLDHLGPLYRHKNLGELMLIDLLGYLARRITQGSFIPLSRLRYILEILIDFVTIANTFESEIVEIVEDRCLKYPQVNVAYWAEEGARCYIRAGRNAALAFFRGETEESRLLWDQLNTSLKLQNVERRLTLYMNLICDQEGVSLRPSTQLSQELINEQGEVERQEENGFSTDGVDIYLPTEISISPDQELNYLYYLTGVAHEVAHIEFKTFDFNLEEISDQVKRLKEKYNKEREDKKEKAKSKSELIMNLLKRRGMEVEHVEPPSNKSDLTTFFELFPSSKMARYIANLVEDGRVDMLLYGHYPGLRKSNQTVARENWKNRPPIDELEDVPAVFESVLQLTLMRKVKGKVPEGNKSAIRDIYYAYHKIFSRPDPTIYDTALLTEEIYDILNQRFRLSDNERYYLSVLPQTLPYRGGMMPDYAEKVAGHLSHEGEKKGGGEREVKMAEQPQEKGDYAYPEWDHDIKAYRPDWCSLKEETLSGEDENIDLSFYLKTQAKYRGTIAKLRKSFLMAKPETFIATKGWEDGDEVDVDALYDAIADFKAGGSLTDRLYIKTERKVRDVAVAFLVDASFSTSREVSSDLTIMDLEKEALILMEEALEAIGDQHAIYSFQDTGREKINFYIIKDFADRYEDRVKSQIGALFPTHGFTRMGAALRHTIHKMENVDAKTKLILIITDGQPEYLSFLGDEIFMVEESSWEGRTVKGSQWARGYQLHSEDYAYDDVKQTLLEARLKGIHSFCVAIPGVGPARSKALREAETYLDKMFDGNRYIIVDNILNLPYRLPHIFKKLTT